MDCERLNKITNSFEVISLKPERFLSAEDDLNDEVKSLLKTSYDWTKSQETSPLKNSSALPELIIQNFDLEQIWQQIDLQNDSFIPHSLVKVSKLVTQKNKLLFFETKDFESTSSQSHLEEHVDDKEGSEANSSSDDDDDEPLNLREDSDELAFNSDDLSDGNDSNDEDRIEDTDHQPKKKAKTSIVDDQFFKLDEMEAFLEAEEKKINEQEPDSGNDSEEESDEGMEDDDDVDLFEDANEMERNDTERGAINNPKYKDFFGEPDRGIGGKSDKRNKFLQELEDQQIDEQDREENRSNEEEEEEEAKKELKSTLELRNERLQQRMEELEEIAVSEKPWQLKGEITAEQRPQNSLLEEIVDFDLTSRPAPVITEQTSMILEDVIRQRIKDKAFDSVQRKEKPVETPLEYKKKLVLDQEKSKESLAQIYEKEYLEKVEALDGEEKEEEEPQLHKEIKKMMHELFSKLDALSNFHYTPKPVQPELKIVSNLPAITMEEVAPVTTSDAALLAPEEVKGKVRGDIIGKSERTDTDKKRERRKKKDKQKMHAAIQKKKQNLGLGNKYSKEKADKMLKEVTKEKNVDKMDESLGSKNIKSSKAFFTQLEDQVKAQIGNKIIRKNKTKNNATQSAKKLKL